MFEHRDANGMIVSCGDIQQVVEGGRVLVEQMADAAAAERIRIIGAEDDHTPAGLGILDRFEVFAQHAPNGALLIWVRCGTTCGAEGNGTLLITARDLEGSQDGLTLAELAHQALRHWQEEHHG